MKHLIKYKIFESNIKDIEIYLKDIGMGLTDDGFKVIVKKINGIPNRNERGFKQEGYMNWYGSITIYKPTNFGTHFSYDKFSGKEVIDTIEMIWSYMNEQGFNTRVLVTYLIDNERSTEYNLLYNTEDRFKSISYLTDIGKIDLFFTKIDMVKKISESIDINPLEITNDLKDVFIELEDDGFNISADRIESYSINFPKSNMSIPGSLDLFPNSIHNAVKVIISKKMSAYDTSLGIALFEISDILENLLFIESYVEEIGLKIDYILPIKPLSIGRYYKNVSSIGEYKCEFVQIVFSKK